jgi:hypothetical protein
LSFSLKKSFEGNRVKEERNNKFFNSLIFKKMQKAHKVRPQKTTVQLKPQTAQTLQERKQKMKTPKIKHLPKVRKLRQPKLPRLRQVAPLQWITNPQTLKNSPQQPN